MGAAASLGEGQEACRSRDLSSAFLLVPQPYIGARAAKGISYQRRTCWVCVSPCMALKMINCRLASAGLASSRPS